MAKKIAKCTGIQIYHLDKEYWLPNWQKPKEEDWHHKIVEFVKEDSWIMDGNYIDTLEDRLEKADLVIMLDIKTSTCLRGVFLRTLKSKFIKRKDLCSDCDERFNQNYYDFINWVKAFRKEYFPKLINICLKYPNVDLKIFSTRKSTHKFVKRMTSKNDC